MKDRINDKINDIEKYLEELYNLISQNIKLEEYKKDLKIKAVYERYFEKIIEAIVDLAFLTIRYKKLKMPEDEENSFIILNENNIISKVISTKLIQAKGMRNIIIHEYGEIDDEKIFNSVKEELRNDTEEFLNNIKSCINEKEVK
jgi:uncharacterized protein YutE (UPF0331/DUF86 family)